MLYARGAHSDAFRQYEGTSYPGTIILDNAQIFKAKAAAAGIK
jgi:hypothetical protein